MIRGLRPDRRVLPNGATVTVAEVHTVPAAAIHLLVKAGGVYEPPAQPGLAYFASRLLDRGTRTRTADQIGDLFDRRGAVLSVAANRHAVTLTCQCLAEDLPALVDAVVDVASEASFPAAEVELRRREIITAIQQDEDSPATMAGEALMAVLYPGHPYGARPRGDLAGVQARDAADLRRFHADRFRPDACSLVLVGDLDAAQAHDLAARALGSWQGSSAPAPRLDTPPPAT